jgi:hypothetical protein
VLGSVGLEVPSLYPEQLLLLHVEQLLRPHVDSVG